MLAYPVDPCDVLLNIFGAFAESQHVITKNTTHAVLTLRVKLTVTSTRLARALMNAQTHLRRVFGSTAPADAPTVEHPGLCLGYTFMK